MRRVSQPINGQKIAPVIRLNRHLAKVENQYGLLSDCWHQRQPCGKEADASIENRLESHDWRAFPADRCFAGELKKSRIRTAHPVSTAMYT